MTRREAMRAGGAGLALLMTPALLAACGGGGEQVGADASDDGPVISGQAFAPITFDPHTASELGALTTILYTYESLYDKAVQSPHAIEPQLAAGDPEQLSPTRVRVRLREGARFHDGRPVTGADVAASFERLLNPDTASLLAGWLTMVRTVEADGDGAVVIDLRFPTTLLRDRLALVRIMPASLAAERAAAAVFNTRPVGSGPYALTSISSDLRSVRLDRFADYNGPTRVSLDQIGLDTIADDQARVAALQTRRVAAITDPPFNGLQQLGDENGLDAAGTPSFQQSIMIFNNSNGPFADARVRQAVLLAIDREAITEAVFFGNAEAATSYLPTQNPDYKRPATSLAYDPERARALLAEAGVPDLSFELLLSNLGWLSAQAPLIESNWRDVGIRAKIVQGEVEALARRVVEGRFDIYLTVTDPSVFGNGDGQFLIQWVYGNLAEGFLHWTDPSSRRMAGLLDSAVRASTPADVRGLVGEMQDLIAAQAPAFPLHHRYATGAWSTALDLELNPVYAVDLREARLAA